MLSSTANKPEWATDLTKRQYVLFERCTYVDFHQHLKCPCQDSRRTCICPCHQTNKAKQIRNPEIRTLAAQAYHEARISRGLTTIPIEDGAYHLNKTKVK